MLDHLTKLAFKGFLVTASIITKRILPPSRAGNGTMFMTAKFIEIIAVIFSKYTKPSWLASFTTPAIPTGPVTCEKSDLKVIVSSKNFESPTVVAFKRYHVACHPDLRDCNETFLMFRPIP